MRIWMKCLALFGVLTPLLFGACGGIPDNSLLRFTGVKACNPNVVFKPLNGIPLKDAGKFEPNIFVKGDRAGCIGVFWEGQTGNSPYFATVIKQDGSYIVYDPNTKQPVVGKNKLGATVAPGVSEVNVVICVMNSPTSKVLDLDCKNIVKGQVSGCLNNTSALYAWQGKLIPMEASKGNGTCTLCHHEVCDGKDNDCNGKVDDGGACGRILGKDCKSYADLKSAPKCNSKEACQCIRLPNKDYYVCYGKTTGAVQWTKVSSAAATCTKAVSQSPDPNVNRSFCGSISLVCDTCDKKLVWRTKGRCSEGQLRNP